MIDKVQEGLKQQPELHAIKIETARAERNFWLKRAALLDQNI